MVDRLSTRWMTWFFLLRWLAATPFVQAQEAVKIERTCDIVIAEASLGGIAAALQASRLIVHAGLNATVCLTSMTDWVGGQMTTQGVSAVDEPSLGHADEELISQQMHSNASGLSMSSNSYFSEGAYSSQPHADEVIRTMKPFLDPLRAKSPCWVSRYCFAPDQGDLALKNQLKPFVDRGVLKIFYETVPKRVQMSSSGTIDSVEFVQRKYTGNGPRPYGIRLSDEILDWYSPTNSNRYKKQTLKLNGKIFIDGTETGELIVLSGAHHNIGFDGRTGETGKEPECVMSFTFPINLLGRAPTPAEIAKLKALGTDPGEEEFNLQFASPVHFWANSGHDPSSVFQYRQILSSPPITSMNWGEAGNDFRDESFIIPYGKLGSQLTDWQGGIRTHALASAERRSYAFALWLNTLPDVKKDGKGVVPIFDQSSVDNHFGTGTGLAKFPYVRETRRLIGYKQFTIYPMDITMDKDRLGHYPNLPEFTNFQDSIGIGAYRMDYRKCNPALQTEIWYPIERSNHYQIPLRAAISENVPNLLAGNKSISMNQQSNAGYRVHPTEWNIGYGVGSAAMVAVAHSKTMHQLIEDVSLVREVQRKILSTGGRVLWFSDHLPYEIPGNEGLQAELPYPH